MKQFPELVVIGMAAGLILTAAWQDFTSWKIRNWTVLALIALYAALALLRVVVSSDPGFPGELGRSPLLGDLAAGLLLFMLGFLLWALRMFGAGDAKLFFPVGLFVGLNFLFPFGMALAMAGIVVAVALRFPIPLHYQVWPAVARFEEIRRTGKVPYGVLIAVAALFAMYLRYVA